MVLHAWAAKKMLASVCSRWPPLTLSPSLLSSSDGSRFPFDNLATWPVASNHLAGPTNLVQPPGPTTWLVPFDNLTTWLASKHFLGMWSMA